MEVIPWYHGIGAILVGLDWIYRYFLFMENNSYFSLLLWNEDMFVSMVLLVFVSVSVSVCIFESMVLLVSVSVSVSVKCLCQWCPCAYLDKKGSGESVTRTISFLCHLQWGSNNGSQPKRNVLSCWINAMHCPVLFIQNLLFPWRHIYTALAQFLGKDPGFKLKFFFCRLQNHFGPM